MSSRKARIYQITQGFLWSQRTLVAEASASGAIAAEPAWENEAMGFVEGTSIFAGERWTRRKVGRFDDSGNVFRESDSSRPEHVGRVQHGLIYLGDRTVGRNPIAEVEPPEETAAGAAALLLVFGDAEAPQAGLQSTEAAVVETIAAAFGLLSSRRQTKRVTAIDVWARPHLEQIMHLRTEGAVDTADAVAVRALAQLESWKPSDMKLGGSAAAMHRLVVGCLLIHRIEMRPTDRSHLVPEVTRVLARPVSAQFDAFALAMEAGVFRTIGKPREALQRLEALVRLEPESARHRQECERVRLQIVRQGLFDVVSLHALSVLITLHMEQVLERMRGLMQTLSEAQALQGSPPRSTVEAFYRRSTNEVALLMGSVRELEDEVEKLGEIEGPVPADVEEARKGILATAQASRTQSQKALKVGNEMNAALARALGVDVDPTS